MNNIICTGIILLALTGVSLSGKKSLEEKKSWWRYTEIYEIFIWSFKDSNGDGIGDINGITTMLDHFCELNVETIWISPYFQSPKNDMGYDVSHFTKIYPDFGTMDDFDNLMAEMKNRGMKCLMDLVINHSSDKHIWFKKSALREAPYTDYYIWVSPKGFDKNGTPIPPNNWVSLFGGSAWEWNPIRNQFYLHQFSKHQVELNLRNPDVKNSMKKIIKFWLDRGIAGFRLDATRYYMEDPLLRDDIPIFNNNTNERKNETMYEDFEHIYTADLQESYELIHELRQFVDDNYNNGKDYEKILIAEAYTEDQYLTKYYGNSTYQVTHYPFNFNLLLYSFPNARELDNKVKSWFHLMPPGNVASWVAENHDNYRIGSRLNEQYMDIIVTFIMVLPGVACFYYGQEIGMTDNHVRPDQIRDMFSNVNRPGRDPQRLPMQWDDSLNGGFTTKLKPWLPIHPNYWRVNVESEKSKVKSRYNLFKKLSLWRRTEVSKKGDLKTYIVSKWCYAVVRLMNGHPTYIALFNLGTETEYLDLHMTIFNIPRVLYVLTSSLNAGFSTGDAVLIKPQIPRTIIMRPISCVVFSTASVQDYMP